jgi:hypothetical protein
VPGVAAMRACLRKGEGGQRNQRQQNGHSKHDGTAVHGKILSIGI